MSLLSLNCHFYNGYFKSRLLKKYNYNLLTHMAKYTNLLALILIIMCFVLIFSCKTQHKIVFEKNDLCCKDSVVTKNMYLSNRMPDCDMAIRYMDSVIVPVSLSVPNNLFEIRATCKIPTAIEGHFRIKCDSVNLYDSQKYLYYLNAECFEGLTSADIFKLFCRDDQLDLINGIDSVHFSSGRKWQLIMLAHGGFGVSFDIQGKNVISSSTWKSYSESH